MTSTTDVWLPALRRMQDKHKAIRLVRRIQGADRLDGFIVGVGRKWLLLAKLPDVRVDGFVAVRIRDIQRVQVSPCDQLSRRLLESTGAWPPAGPNAPIDLDRTSRLVQTSYAHAGLLNIQVEGVDPEVALIGSPSLDGKKWVVLDEVTSESEWDGSVSRWRRSEITRVEFSGSYESDLLLVAGPPPPRA